MSDSDFPTTILTSKAPEDVANFLPHSLQLSSTLIEKNLLVWFANYAAMISRYNQDLNALLANGRNFFTGAGGEFGSLDKIWNCVASLVMSQIQVNESLIKVIRKDVLAQFSAAFKEDFKYSELLVNSEELLEMKAHMADSNGAYNWNVKAPVILQNFENYKRFEKEVIFNAFISYLNAVNTKTAGLVHKNENAVNFILKEYHIDNEMQLYTDYVIGTKPPATESKVKKSAPLQEPALPRPLPATRPSVASSINSGSTSGTPVKEKRKSKLRLKVGSILGRKKKDTSSLNHAETIPEDASAASVPSRLGTFISQAETRQSTRPLTGARNEPKPVESRPAAPSAPSAPSAPVAANLNTPPPSSHNNEVKDKSFGQNKNAFQPAFNAQPLQPLQAPRGDISQAPAVPETSQPAEIAKSVETAKPVETPRTAPAVTKPVEDAQAQKPVVTQENQQIPEEAADDEANFVKYSSSDDESDDQVNKPGNRQSLLKTHNLGQPPKVDLDSDIRSRNTSSGKYSFEYGDEAKSISTPQHTPVVPSAPQLEPFGKDAIPVTPEKPVEKQVVNPQPELLSVPTPIQTKEVPQSPSASVRPPPPPPSRKAHAIPAEVQRDVQNLHNNRDSFIQPHAGDRMSLVSQTTGNSLLRQDHFKHFGASEEPIREGLNTSIAEIINATFKDGQVAKAQVLGEIAFNYNSTKPLDSLTINIPTKFSKYLLNDQLMTKHDSERYTLNLAHIAGKTLGGIKYLIDQSYDHVPVLVKQIWKFEPKQASLIIKLSLNPAYSKRVTLENFTISASLDPSVASISASSKPEGSFNKEVNRITWRYTEPLEFNSSSEVKLIARIMTTGLAKESPSGTRLRFTISEGAAPKVKILDSAHQPVPSISSLTSGNYSSHI